MTWYVSSPGCDAVWSSGSCNSLKHDRVTMGRGQMGERDRGKSNEVNLLFPQGIIRGNYSTPHAHDLLNFGPLSSGLGPCRFISAGGKNVLHLQPYHLFGFCLDCYIETQNSLDRSKLRPSQTPTNHPSEFFGHITFSVPNIKL